jgi:large subunit ribosomal protein L10
VSALKDKFSRATGVIFTDYKGLTVEEMSEFRRQLNEASLEYRVVKNTLARRALEGTSAESAKDILTGPIGVAISYDDPSLLAKKVLAFIKSNEKLKIRAGVIEGRSCGDKEIKAVSELPSRETLLAMLVGVMQSPLGKLASALNATVARFAYALEAAKEKKST